METFDPGGRRVKAWAARYGAGPHELEWDHRGARGEAVANGVCLVRVVEEERVRTAPLVVLR